MKTSLSVLIICLLLIAFALSCGMIQSMEDRGGKKHNPNSDDDDDTIDSDCEHNGAFAYYLDECLFVFTINDEVQSLQDLHDTCDQCLINCFVEKQGCDYMFQCMTNNCMGPDDNDDDDDDDNEDGCPEPSTCYQNTAPVLIDDPMFKINGETATDFTGAVTGDSLELLFPFEDAQCNIDCGAVSIQYSAGLSQGGGADSLGTGYGCSTAESGKHIGLYFTLTSPGTLSYSIKAADFCDAWSNKLEGNIPVGASN